MGKLFAIFGTLVGGLVGFGSLLVKWFTDTKKEEGRLEERANQLQRESAAKERANEVMAERRDPDDAVKRLRDGTF